MLGLFFWLRFPNIRHQSLYVFTWCWGSAADEKSDNKIGNHRNASNAPEDLIAGMGKNGQYLDVFPSRNLVIIRMG